MVDDSNDRCATCAQNYFLSTDWEKCFPVLENC